MDATALTAYRQYLRRAYANNLSGLKELATAAAAELATGVVITATSSEAGGSASGQLAVSPSERLDAIEAVILELDPATPRPSRQSIAYLR